MGFSALPGKMAGPDIRHAFAQDAMTDTSTLVLGATGFLGRHLVSSLLRSGSKVIALSRDSHRARQILDDRVRVVERLEDLSSDLAIHAVVNLAGAAVLGVPWTASRRKQLLASRIGPATAAMGLMARLRKPPSVLVAASAVGYYGATPNAGFEPRDESSPPRPGQFQSDLCVAVERAAQQAETLGVRVVRPRFGVVLGIGGGAYPLMSPSARFGFGAVLGSGLQPAPWVHLDDAVGLLRLALQREGIAGPLNVVAPEVPTQKAFVEAMAASFGRKVRLRLPAAPMGVVGGEMLDLLLEGQNPVPRAALAAGYVYRHPRLRDAMVDLASRG